MLCSESDDKRFKQITTGGEGRTTKKNRLCNSNFFIGGRIMLSKKGFTLIELMVVILIVSILAAVAIPIMRGRIDSAKWSEGKAMGGSIATGIRAYYAEKGANTTDPTTLQDLGFATGDLEGTYFKESATAFTWTSDYSSVGVADPILTFTVTINAPSGISPGNRTLDQNGAWLPD